MIAFNWLFRKVWLPLLLLIIWWQVSKDSVSPYFPPLADILIELKALFLTESVYTDVLPSIYRFVTGFVIAIVIGLASGIFIGMSETARLLTAPLVDFFRSMPKSALLPVAIIVLGVDDTMKIALIAFGSVWAVLLNTIDGVRGVDEVTLQMADSYRLSRLTKVRRIILPASLPQFFAGARVSLAIALILMVISEMQASSAGLGYLVLLAQQTFGITEMWAGIIALGLIGYVSNLVLSGVEYKVLRWHKGWRAAEEAV